MRRAFALLPLLLLIAALAAPGTAVAANNAVWYDPPADAVYPAVDIGAVVAGYSDDGAFAVGIRMSRQVQLYGGDLVDVYLDIDRNPATGGGGADYAIFYHQYISGQSISLGRWNGSAMEIIPSRTLTWSTGTNSIVFAIATSEIGSPTSGVGIYALGNRKTQTGGNHYPDRAPDSGTYDFPFTPSTVGGTSGSGEPSATSTREAAAYTRAGMRRHAGARARVKVRSCARLGAASLRCATVAVRGPFRWTGKATVGEHRAADGTERSTFAFRGTRTDARCVRRADSAKARRRCTRSVRW